MVTTIQIISEKVDIFQTVKQISFPEVQQAFDGQEVRQDKVLCPFHNEKTPSFHIYEDGFYCFGCGVYGDGIDFVAKLEGVKPMEAAKTIATRFTLAIDRAPLRREVRKTNELKRRRSISKLYEEIEHRAFLNLIEFKETVSYIIQVCGLDDLDEATVKNVNKLPLVEEYLRILTTGSQEERLYLLRVGVLVEWARLNNSLKQMER